MINEFSDLQNTTQSVDCSQLDSIDRSTIFALSTPYAKAALAIIRISGPLSLSVLAKMTRKSTSFFVSRYVYYLPLYDDLDNVIDFVLASYFSAPKTFTGEDVVEISCHGSIAVIQHLIEHLSSQNGLRLAERGEFTRRAFLNDKMDMVQVEGLASLIDSETRAQKKIALQQNAGVTSKMYGDWRQQIIQITAQIEALIDFPDEDIPISILNNCIESAVLLGKKMKELIDNSNSLSFIANGISLVFFGSPNAGKSSIINMLAQDDIAIVSNVAGTTRDILKTTFVLGDWKITLSDTAGLREKALDSLEQEGINRAQSAIRSADLRIYVIDIEEIILALSNSLDNRAALMEAILIPNYIVDFLTSNGIESIDALILNKIDALERLQSSINPELLGSLIKESIQMRYGISIQQVVCLCALPSPGIQTYRKILCNCINAAIYSSKHNLELLGDEIIANARQKSNICEAHDIMNRFIASMRSDIPIDICAADLREAIKVIEAIIGAVSCDDVLDEIFSKFCIGK